MKIFNCGRPVNLKIAPCFFPDIFVHDEDMVPVFQIMQEPSNGALGQRRGKCYICIEKQAHGLFAVLSGAVFIPLS